MVETTQKSIDSIIFGIRNNDQKSAEELICRFHPLIITTCLRIHSRYSGFIEMEEMIKTAESLVIYLAGVKYDPTRKVAFSYFLQKHLHAGLVLYYRPTAKYRSLVNNDTVDIHKIYNNSAIRKERRKVVRQINDFMWHTFNQRELDLMVNHVINDTPRKIMIQKHNMNVNQIKYLKRKCLNRLRLFLGTLGIRNVEEI